MKGCKIVILVAVICLFSSFLYADIYEWTDENGVKHFTNYAPPDNAKIMMKTEEVPYDEAADLARIEAENQQRLELARQEIAEREAELERREAEAERRLAELEREAERSAREPEDLLDDAAYDRYTNRSNAS